MVCRLFPATYNNRVKNEETLGQEGGVLQQGKDTPRCVVFGTGY